MEPPDYRPAPMEPTFLITRHGYRVEVLRHAACLVNAREGLPITALCRFPNGEVGEIHYSEFRMGRSEWRLYYGVDDHRDTNKKISTRFRELGVNPPPWWL